MRGEQGWEGPYGFLTAILWFSLAFPSLPLLCAVVSAALFPTAPLMSSPGLEGGERPLPFPSRTILVLHVMFIWCPLSPPFPFFPLPSPLQWSPQHCSPQHRCCHHPGSREAKERSLLSSPGDDISGAVRNRLRRGGEEEEGRGVNNSGNHWERSE